MECARALSLSVEGARPFLGLHLYMYEWIDNEEENKWLLEKGRKTERVL